jgi:hypothetical protein
MSTIGNSLAHTFTNNESAAFLALIDNMKIQASLIQQSVSSGNIDIAKQHIGKLKELYSNHTNEEIAEKNERIANEISTTINYFTSSITSSNQNNFSKSQIDANIQNLNAILDESISVRIPHDVLDNSTVQALHFVELINAVDMNYNNTPVEQEIQNMSLNNNNNNNNTEFRSQIKDVVSYNTARELLNVAIDLYESKLKNKIILNTNNSETIDKLQEGIMQLKTSIELKKPTSEINNTINGTIYPTLVKLYNLKIGEEAAHTEEEEDHSGASTIRDSVTVLLQGFSIPANNFIHLYDSTPYHIMNGHVALKVPCEDDSTSPIQILIGSAPNMTTATLENIAQLSTPGEQCLYHVDLIPSGNVTTLTDIALKNSAEEDIEFPPSSTVVIGINEVEKGKHGHSEGTEAHTETADTTTPTTEEAARHTE